MKTFLKSDYFHIFAIFNYVLYGQKGWSLLHSQNAKWGSLSA